MSISDERSHLSVALITPWERKGGIARYSKQLSDALRGADIEPIPVPIDPSENANPLEFTELLGDVPDRADIIHVQFEAGLFGRLIASGIGAPAFFYQLNNADRPTVTTLHEVHRKHPHRGILGNILLRYRDKVIEHFALKASDVTVVHTREAEQILKERHSDKHRIERCLYPVEGTATLIDTQKAKSELNLPEYSLLSFGWIEEKKRYNNVIQALTELPEITYVIAGEPRNKSGEEYLKSMLSLAESLGVSDQVRHLGYVPDDKIPILFSAADAAVFPYNRVSQSAAINDALTYHLPVVASELPAFEELRDRFGCILTYQSKVGLVEALNKVMFDESTRKRLKQRAQNYTESVTWSRFGEQTRGLYESIQ